MRKIASILLAAIFAVSTVGPLVISADTAMAAKHEKAKDKKADKKAAKKPAKKAAKKAAKKKDRPGMCGTNMYYDKKTKKCADARLKK